MRPNIKKYSNFVTNLTIELQWDIIWIVRPEFISFDDCIPFAKSSISVVVWIQIHIGFSSTLFSRFLLCFLLPN